MHAFKASANNLSRAGLQHAAIGEYLFVRVRKYRQQLCLSNAMVQQCQMRYLTAGKSFSHCWRDHVGLFRSCLCRASSTFFTSCTMLQASCVWRSFSGEVQAAHLTDHSSISFLMQLWTTTCQDKAAACYLLKLQLPCHSFVGIIFVPWLKLSVQAPETPSSPFESPRTPLPESVPEESNGEIQSFSLQWKWQLCGIILCHAFVFYSQYAMGNQPQFSLVMALGCISFGCWHQSCINAQLLKSINSCRAQQPARSSFAAQWAYIIAASSGGTFVLVSRWVPCSQILKVILMHACCHHKHNLILQADVLWRFIVSYELSQTSAMLANYTCYPSLIFDSPQFILQMRKGV